MNGLRSRIARAWLELFFWCTLHAPFVPRILRPGVLALTWLSAPAIRAGTLANARRILGDESSPAARRQLGRAVLRSFYDSGLRFAQNRGRATSQILSSIESVEGRDGYERARQLRRGAILVTAHLGPFETAVASLRQREPRVHVVFRRDTMTVFERLRSEQRQRLDVIEAPIDDGLGMWFKLRDALLADEVVLLQGDRTMRGQRGVRVPFLHGHIEIPEGPVKLAQITGSPIIPTFAVLTRQRTVQIIIGKPILVGGASDGPFDTVPPEEALLQLAAAIADIVRRYPEQWLVLERAWVEDRGEARG